MLLPTIPGDREAISPGAVVKNAAVPRSRDRGKPRTGYAHAHDARTAPELRPTVEPGWFSFWIVPSSVMGLEARFELLNRGPVRHRREK